MAASFPPGGSGCHLNSVFLPKFQILLPNIIILLPKTSAFLPNYLNLLLNANIRDATP